MKLHGHKFPDIANNNSKNGATVKEDGMDKIIYNKIALKVLNNWALADGLIDEETKWSIDRQIEAMRA